MFRKLSRFKTPIRGFAAARLKEKLKINRWAIHSYGDLSELELSSSSFPIIEQPNDVQVLVKAASVNPIDVMMLKGYGQTLISLIRKEDIEFPLILGRDFSGTVIGKGHLVGDKFKIGDEIYGFVPLHKQGSFTDVLISDKNHLLKKPKQLSHLESASLVYAGMTAWSALFVFGQLMMKNTQHLRVLIIGASGGVGTIAVQMLKSQNCTVFASCSTDAVDLVKSLGADVVFDYKDTNYLENVASEGKYHLILDAAQFGIDNVPKNWNFEQYITLNSPLLKNTDSNGLVKGLMQSGKTLVEKNVQNCGKTWKWAFIVPSSHGFEFLNDLIRNGQIKPVIHREFDFENLPEAFEFLSKGHIRGKVVVNLK